MEPFLQVVNDSRRQSARLLELLSRHRGVYVLCLGSTETSEIEGISAAGATPAGRRLTPSIDADLLKFGHPREGEAIPVSPKGVVSPVVISRACLKAMDMMPRIVDCGTFRTPLKSDLTAGRQPANCVSTGNALPYAIVVGLFEQGRRFAETLSDEKYVILSECVPGGTTTALALLKAFGVEADALVSSSLPVANELRGRLIADGLKKSSLGEKPDPLRVVSAIGDPVQPFLAGAALQADQRVPVILGGGSQMLAIYHLCKQLSDSFNHALNRASNHLWNQASPATLNSENVFVVTTKWITSDAYSNTRRLSEMLDAPFFASSPDFSLSRFAGLRAYEEGHVKEGVGAGALMLAAKLSKQLSRPGLMEIIDDCYEELVIPAKATNSPSSNSGRHFIPS